MATQARGQGAKRRSGTGQQQRRRRKASPRSGIDILGYVRKLEELKFWHILLVLVLILAWRHGISLRIGEAIYEGWTERGELAESPHAQLAGLEPSIKLSPAQVEKRRKEYIKKYAPIAKKEMRRSGIPASITLAQGLLESVAGSSRLATETNNHFGIKCFSKSCAPGHSVNFNDDHHKDFFRNYKKPEESFRDHSEFLRKGSRYKALFRLPSDDYASWARGLSKSGYATDPQYADKLIALIKRYELHQYD